MKYSILMAMIVMILVSCSAQQEPIVPQNVKTAFSTKFPAATDVEWEEDEDEYEAEFEFEGKSMSANFSNKGAWVETEYEVELDELPSDVSTSVSGLYPGFEIEEVEMIETPDMKGYEIDIEKGEESKEVVLDLNGRFIKEKASEVEKDDKNDKNKDDD